jgi:His-Xaa-Ser system radical SAM maturase HxsB
LGGRRVLVNEAGEHHIIGREDFQLLVEHSLPAGSPTYYDLKAKHFLSDTGETLPVALLALKYRTKRSFLAGFTKLHIFVVTLRCDHSCKYCQVSRVSMDRSKFDMTRETGLLALDAVFRSPSPTLKIEFQGGEPLLNFDLIRFIIEEAERRNVIEGRDLQFVVTTNLAFISDEILSFLRDRRVLVSTSLDGPGFIHNANRPRPGGDAYERTIEGIRRARDVLGHDSVAAIMTTSRLSLDYPLEIVDEYVAQGFASIFLRPLSPYGFAARTHKRTGYEVERFLEFYKQALSYIIELNRRGTRIVESYSQLLLSKIVTPFPTGYVDLQSPSGAGIGAVVYNYDGGVYASDEARMLAEMGDSAFLLGRLQTNTYEEMFGGTVLRSLVEASIVESIPHCSDCAFQAYCGADPIENYATQGTLLGHRPTSSFCRRNMERIKHLLSLYHDGDDFTRRLFWSWVQRAPLDELLPAVPE